VVWDKKQKEATARQKAASPKTYDNKVSSRGDTPAFKLLSATAIVCTH
jgi:hypothetical protein